MPNRNGTGPKGEGPKTGAQKGDCQGAQHTKFSKGKGNRGCGRKKGEGNKRKTIDTTIQE